MHVSLITCDDSVDKTHAAVLPHLQVFAANINSHPFLLISQFVGDELTHRLDTKPVVQNRRKTAAANLRSTL